MKRPQQGRGVALAALAAISALLAMAAAAAWASGADAGSSVDLARGKLGPYEWSVRVEGTGGRAGAKRARAQSPCLSVTALLRRGRFDYRRTRFRQCVHGPGRLAPSDGPLIASAGQPSDRSSPEMTAVGMLAAPGTRRVRITLPSGRIRAIHFDELTRSEAHAAGLSRLRYAAFVVHGAWCAERIVTENAAGKVLWDSGVDEYTCESSG
jgi:hypothetical protein